MSMYNSPSSNLNADQVYPADIEKFRADYDFPLDAFQLDAATAIDAGRGVLVAAPTGAGKTIVGEFAVFKAFHNNGTCFYTTPIKALSNQKYHDLVERYGESNVGLLTGDVTLNGDAPIVVMTTEVLRNMIYADSERLDTLTHVVMDEVHFLADKSRGAVWEEAILNLDPRVVLVSLSATVSNVEEFGGWLSTVRGDTNIIVTERRPIPLQQHMMVGRQILPLFDGEEQDIGAINRAVIAAAARAEETGKRRGPKRSDVVQHMYAKHMLPAIYFIFSRAGCEGAVKQLLVDKVDFSTPKQREEILTTVDDGVKDIAPEDLEIIGFRQWRRAISRGFAAHHAGMLPTFRHIVEDLFARGLLKVCFATETLALGINMPARSVVLERLIKYNGEAHVDLTPGQYTQLTGRAGRRGIDTTGNAVVLWSQGIDPYAVADLASTRTYPLDSTFRPGYNMAVNLIATQGLEESLRILDRSFAQYQTNGSVVERAQYVERRRRDVEQQEKELHEVIRSVRRGREGNDPNNELFDQVVEYATLRRKLTQEERRAKRESVDERGKEVTALLRDLQVGDVIALPTGKNPMTAVVARADHKPRFPKPTIITEDGWVDRISPEMFGNTPVLVGHMRLHKGVERNPRRQARSVAANLRRLDVDKPAKLKPKARSGSSIEATALRQDVHHHPVHAWEGREELTRAAEQLLKARRRLDFELGDHPAAQDSLATQFNRILELLEQLDYVELDRTSGDLTGARITMEGERLARLHHESDLLVAQCLRRGIWDELDPAELAAAASVCVFENRRDSGKPASLPTEPLSVAISKTLRVYQELAVDEERHRLNVTRQPELGFATALHQWAAGAPLEYCLTAAEANGASLTPGDFVRWCRQVVDLLEQIKHTGYSDEVKAASRKAIAAIRRGVVEPTGSSI